MEQIQENGGSVVMLEMLRLMVQTVLEEGITQHIGAQPYERGVTRRGHRNGYKPRTVKTRLGELWLSVPQARGVAPFEPYPLVKWQRSECALLVACAEMYFQGVGLNGFAVGKVISSVAKNTKGDGAQRIFAFLGLHSRIRSMPDLSTANGRE